jgi:DNA invertase Pin-like site-specific DNA recombinase
VALGTTIQLARQVLARTYWTGARERGKAVVCLEPHIDLSTPTGQLVGMVMSWLAEQELAQPDSERSLAGFT